MPRSGALQLKDFPHSMVRFACTNCPRKGQLRLETLLAEFGSDITLPDLRVRIARCERHGKWGAACGIYYEDLKPK